MRKFSFLYLHKLMKELGGFKEAQQNVQRNHHKLVVNSRQMVSSVAGFTHRYQK
jgi:hypothetical protein